MARPRQHAPDTLHTQVMAVCDRWLTTRPVHDLSLRAIAREVGCAPSTLLKLYGSFHNLLQYVNVETLARLQYTISSLKTAAPEPWLRSLVHAYWQFSEQDCYRWQLLFDYPLADGGELDQRQSGLIEALFVEVETCLREFQPALGELEARELGRMLWGSVHGLVQLGLNERLGYWQGEQLQVDQLLDRLLTTVLAGLRHRGPTA
ncbi:TetR-like C-terminal domain-containing protein [Halomonas cibimaris]|uniref:TetR-like C-terminal domain-containing protein n=1 Tax=Halomonas cibimaris TaxID=657012 RepID=A0ABP7M061_9GAMM